MRERRAAAEGYIAVDVLMTSPATDFPSLRFHKNEVGMLRIIARVFAVAAAFALAAPTLAEAQSNEQGKPPGGGARPAARPAGPAGGARPAYRAQPGPRPAVVGPRPSFGGPHPRPGPEGALTWRGQPINRVHVASFVYPNGWAYRRWAIGAALPALFLAPAYYYTDWAAFGLPPPDPGFQWVRYGPDLLLVNVATGEVVDVIYGAFY
jgi:Ni/Co efflux regulator RcnB